MSNDFREHLTNAITIVGSQTALANCIGTKPQNVSYWLRLAKEVPVNFSTKIERATGVNRQNLSPITYNFINESK